MNQTSTYAVIAALGIAAAASADIGVVEATGAFTFPGSGSPSYVSAIGAGQNPRLDGYGFGPIDTLAGQSLLINNWFFENYAYNGGSTPPGAATNNNWLDGANVAALTIEIRSSGFAGTTLISSNTYSLYQTYTNGNNRGWQLVGGAQGTNLAAGLANGVYLAKFTTTYNANQWTGYTSQFNASTATSTASFSIVPAPGALTLLGVAGITGSARRRR